MHMTTAAMRVVIVAVALLLGIVVLGNAFPDGGPHAAPVADETQQQSQPQTPQTPAGQAAQSPPSTGPTRVDGVVLQVLNGTEESGLAASTAEELEQFGYDIGTRVGDAARNYRVTTLFHQPDARAHAELLAADFFPGARLEEVENDQAPEVQVTVVLGEDALD